MKPKLPCHTLPPTQHHRIFRKLPPLLISVRLPFQCDFFKVHDNVAFQADSSQKNLRYVKMKIGWRRKIHEIHLFIFSRRKEDEKRYVIVFYFPSLYAYFGFVRLKLITDDGFGLVKLKQFVPCLARNVSSQYSFLLVFITKSYTVQLKLLTQNGKISRRYD